MVKCAGSQGYAPAGIVIKGSMSAKSMKFIDGKTWMASVQPWRNIYKNLKNIVAQKKEEQAMMLMGGA